MNKHIKQAKRIADSANYAAHEWMFSCSEVGTFYSKRGKRTFRGSQLTDQKS